MRLGKKGEDLSITFTGRWLVRPTAYGLAETTDGISYGYDPRAHKEPVLRTYGSLDEVEQNRAASSLMPRGG